MQAANDNTLTRLQLEINRALYNKDSASLIEYIGRYMKASDMKAKEYMLLNIPLVNLNKSQQASKTN